MKAVFQNNMPKAELIVKLKKFILSTPAGIDISVLAMGISFPTKTPILPFSLRNRKFLSIISSCLGIFAKYFLRRYSHPILPMKYRTQLPKRPAIKVRMTTVINPTSPLDAQTPAIGIIIPEGKPGRFRYSKNTIIKTIIIP